MTPTVQLPMHKRIVVVALFASGLWFLSTKGYVQDRESSPGPAMSVAARPEPADSGPGLQGLGVPISIADGRQTESLRLSHQALKHAASLLQKAADVLETDEFVAVQLIRQVIAILKYEVIPSLIEPDTAVAPIVLPSTMTDKGTVSEEPAALSIQNASS